MSLLFDERGLRLLPTWNGDTGEILVCRQILIETHDVRTFVFASPEPRSFGFVPGQFLTLELEIGGETINRCYTISSAPTRPSLLSITVKRQPGGVVSNWLHDNLKVGDRIKATGPLGVFSFVNHSAPKYLFLSGGSGITPLMSMTRTLHDLAEDADIVFVHCARSPADIIFRHELDLIAERSPRCQVTFVCETDAGDRRWSGLRGRLSRAMLELIAADLHEREVFVCGPAPFMAGVRHMLGTAGFDMGRHHEESFDFDAQEPLVEPAEGEAPALTTYTIEFTKAGKTITCSSDTNILDAARAAGLPLPSMCRRGLCGTCKCRKTSGFVEMNHGGGIRQREIDQGMVLLCCSKPRSDMVIDR